MDKWKECWIEGVDWKDGRGGLVDGDTEGYSTGWVESGAPKMTLLETIGMCGAKAVPDVAKKSERHLMPIVASLESQPCLVFCTLRVWNGCCER